MAINKLLIRLCLIYNHLIPHPTYINVRGAAGCWDVGKLLSLLVRPPIYLLVTSIKYKTYIVNLSPSDTVRFRRRSRFPSLFRFSTFFTTTCMINIYLKWVPDWPWLTNLLKALRGYQGGTYIYLSLFFVSLCVYVYIYTYFRQAFSLENQAAVLQCHDGPFCFPLFDVLSRCFSAVFSSPCKFSASIAQTTGTRGTTNHLQKVIHWVEPWVHTLGEDCKCFPVSRFQVSCTQHFLIQFIWLAAIFPHSPWFCLPNSLVSHCVPPTASLLLSQISGSMKHLLVEFRIKSHQIHTNTTKQHWMLRVTLWVEWCCVSVFCCFFSRCIMCAPLNSIGERGDTVWNLVCGSNGMSLCRVFHRGVLFLHVLKKWPKKI